VVVDEVGMIRCIGTRIERRLTKKVKADLDLSVRPGLIVHYKRPDVLGSDDLRG
jgi:hypothetical protein